MTTRPLARYALHRTHFDNVYPADVRARIHRLTQIDDERPDPILLHHEPELFAEVEVLLTGWGAPKMHAQALAEMPKLRAVLHAAGSVRAIVSEELWQRGIQVSSAFRANARPVAEFTVAQVIYALKHGWRLVLAARTAGRPVAPDGVPGVMDATVGLLSLGVIGREVAARLRSYDVHVIAHDPYVDPADAAALDVRLVDLPTLFDSSDVVSIHTPLLPSTTGMVDAPLLSSMKPYATLINTARGALIDQEALEKVLTERPDLFAALDVTHPEQPPGDSMLFALPNVVVTPHIAGSLGNEQRRLGQHVADELERLVAGEPLQGEVTRTSLGLMA